MSVSVVIPVKDDGELLRRCLHALARQTTAPQEIIVVDNGSRDDSAQIAQQCGAFVITCDEPGIPAASAAGYDAASGDYILRLDADCLPEKNWVETIHRRFLDQPCISVLTGGARFLEGPRSLRTWASVLYLGSYAVIAVAALGHLPLFGSNLAFRRSAWLQIRDQVHLDADLHDDLDLAYHFGERHYIGFAHGAHMGISSRPLTSASGMLRRTHRGLRTVLSHWPLDFPPLRVLRLVLRQTAVGIETTVSRRSSS